jgi:mRNA-binding protein PUF3
VETAANEDQTRSRDYTNGLSLNGADSERPSHASSPWGNSIWNAAPIGSYAFGPAARDNSRPRGKTPNVVGKHLGTDTYAENSALAGATADLAEGKTGSSSLVANSETEWRPSARPTWGENPSAGSIPQARSSGVSPSRKRSIAQPPTSQQYVDNTPSAFFPSSSRGSLSGQGSLAKPVKPFLDPTSTNFTSRHIEALNTGFTNFGFGQADVSSQRPSTGVTSWPDNGSVHSPNEDRRSVANSDHFSPSSGAPSRSGSLPPSRHGAEPGQYGQSMDAFSRFPQPARQGSSFSMANGRTYQERSVSMQSESFHTLGRLAQQQEQEIPQAAHRASMSTNGVTSSYPVDEQLLNDTLGSLLNPQRADMGNHRITGTYTPGNYTNGQSHNHNAQLQSFQFDNTRSAPNGTGARQSPFYSHANTPPTYDRLNPYSSEQVLSHPQNIAQLQHKLVGYQMQQQERPNFIPPSQLHQQQYQHIFPATQLRNPYNYPYAIPNGMHLSALPPHMAMASMGPMMPAQQQQPPRSPREQQVGDGLGAMSLELANFKREPKQSKRWELTDLKDHVVEFAGDQHGSRFIQQKLETANSEVKDSVFRELEENSLQLMQDVFGNYVIQKFFEHGDQTQKKILVGKMKGHVLGLANQMYACRVVQKALEHALTDQQAAMVKELEKDVLKTVKDQNGNHVIQKVIEWVPSQYVHNIVEAFRGNVGVLSVNSYGCRVIQRLLEKIPEPQRRFILTELHAEGPKLITDQYGNYVTQHMIQHGLPEDRAKVLALIKAQFLMFSKHKFASNVVEMCLLCSNDAQRRELVHVVLAKNERGESNVMNLFRDGYGNYVIQKLLDILVRNDYEMFVSALKPELEKAKKIIPGKQCLSVSRYVDILWIEDSD